MKNTLALSFLLLLTFTAFSQTRIGGEVVDKTGNPLPFVNVIFLNSSEGTTTSEKGIFYLKSDKDYKTAEISYIGYETMEGPLKLGDNLNMKIVLKEASESLAEVIVYQGKTSKKNNPAIDILRKIWENRRKNGVKEFNQYQYRRYEKLEFDLNTIDSALIESPIFNGMEFIFEDLDTNAFTAGALDVKTKELLGLVASTVLRCDDCVRYHLETSHKEGLTKEEVMEALSIATLVGGTIVIPHLRRAYEFWETLENKQ
jgi:AhpD family alkylhydroperoxidase